jgi:hypothetical protein
MSEKTWHEVLRAFGVAADDAEVLPLWIGVARANGDRFVASTAGRWSVTGHRSPSVLALGPTPKAAVLALVEKIFDTAMVFSYPEGWTAAEREAFLDTVRPEGEPGPGSGKA